MKKFYRDLEQNYSDILSEKDYGWIRNEVKVLSQQNRRKDLVIRRRILVRYLHDRMGYSFFKIAQLIQRHHSSVMNLYNNHGT